MRLGTFLPSDSLERRKGGGGGGKGGGSGGSSGGKGGGSSGSIGSSGSRGPASSVPGVTSSSGGRGASSYGSGGGNPITIPAGTPFAGRTSGGGTRGQVFGSNQYGSGYPGQVPRSVAGRGFPFGYWPVVWGGVGVGSGAAYLHGREYGNADNSSRPGGVMVQAPLMQTGDNTTYRLIADNSSVVAILSAIESNCSLSTNTITPVAISANDTSGPQPEQAIEYYRSSSIVLTLDGYNNTAVDSSNSNTADTPLPSGLNTTFLDCLNQTIGASAPILDATNAAGPNFSVTTPTIGLLWILVLILRSVA